MGALGSKRQAQCHRGHHLTGENTAPASNGGRRCKACNQAMSQAHNWRVRSGVLLSPAQLTALADEKYAVLARQG